MEIIVHSHANKTHFHKKSCAPSLILKVRVFGTRKWPIAAPDFFLRKSIEEFGLIAVFVRVALELTKRAQHCALLIHLFSCFFFFEIAQVYLRRSDGCKVICKTNE